MQVRTRQTRGASAGRSTSAAISRAACVRRRAARHDDGSGLRAGHDHCPVAQRLNDFGRQSFARAWRERGQEVGECFFAGSGKLGRRPGIAQADRARQDDRGVAPEPVPVRDGSG
jgi:hypothetical protein